VTTDTKRENGGRDKRGRFVTGCAGGPGNPHLKHLASLQSAVRDAVSPDDLRGVLRKLVALAGSGDVHAARVLLDRCLGKPNPEARHIAFELPSLGSSSDILAAFVAVAQSVASGELAIEDAGQIGRLLEGVTKAREATEVEERINALEAAVAAKGGHR